MFPNPTCEISNYIIEPDDGLYNLYLSPEKQRESGITRCLATAETIRELIDYILNKQGDLHDTDILIEFINSSYFQVQYFIISDYPDTAFTLFENRNHRRNRIDNDENIDTLALRHCDKNLIVQF